jgi:hypothetical protein
MKKTGRQLEHLIREIEENLLPDGFDIVANERIFNDSGIQIAEFDIEITGYLGTTHIRWLIECRDRPSEGPAPGSWIEQLVGRRGRFNFNRVTAVSTTGFSEGAIEYAKREDIELRSVDELTIDKIADWFRLTHVDAIVKLGVVNHARLIGDSEVSEAVLESLKRLIAGAGREEPILAHTGSDNLLSVSQAWQAVVNENPQLFDGLVPNGEGRRVKLCVHYPNPSDRYQVRTDKDVVDIVQILFLADLSIVHKQVPVSQITQYSRAQEREIIAQSVRFEVQAGDKVMDIAFHNFGEQDRTLVTLRAGQSGESPQVK